MLKYITKEKILVISKLSDYLDGNSNFYSQAVLPKNAQPISHLNVVFSPLLMLTHKKGFFSEKSEIIDNINGFDGLLFISFLTLNKLLDF